MSFEYGGSPEEAFALHDARESQKKFDLGGRVEYPAGEDRVDLSWSISYPTKKRLRRDINKNLELLSEKEIAQEFRSPGSGEDAFEAGESGYVEQAGEDEAVIFLPGVALDASDASVVNSGLDFANARQAKVINITTRLSSTEREDFIDAQAEAICKFIREQGLKKVLFVGNSQGANKAMTAAYFLERHGVEESPNTQPVEVEGLILTNPGGVVVQAPKQLRNSFFKDAIVNTSREVIAQAARNPDRNAGAVQTSAVLGADVGKGLLREASEGLGQLARRIDRETEEAARVNKYAGEIRAPIVLVVGEKDEAFNADKFVPAVAHDQSVWSRDVRERDMKDKVFHSAVGVRVIKGVVNGVHGLHYLRSDEVAETGVYLLRRIEREREQKDG